MSVYQLGVVKKDAQPLTRREQMFSDFDRTMENPVVVRVDSLNKKYYNSKEVAAIFGYSVRWVVKWRHKIPGAMRVGRQWRFIKKVIDKLDFVKLQNCLKYFFCAVRVSRKLY